MENGVDALNVSSGKDGDGGRRAKGKGGGRWHCYHCRKKCHFKRDCPELKGEDDFVGVSPRGQ
ncbi:hypothetical protein L195_g018439 [Trifolium pratense]|uniref:CCHC-type domain-containing protein n=1 Tax=Trifolium pratense TaxID=57577 RepID=A0A2K3MWS6_TRIPR|nr:hypothetical protein L195_g018439 [Trifolium pratense]